MSEYYKKKALSLIRSKAGREAMEEILGTKIEIVSEEQKAKSEAPKPIVAVLVPVYDHPEPRMSEAVTNMLRAAREAGACESFFGPPCSSSVIHWSRNWLIANLLKSQKPWTHVLFIDDDIVPQPDSLIKLLSHKKDIVAGLCTRRQDPPIPNVRLFDENRKLYTERWSWPENALTEVDAIGTGLMLISKHALEQVAEVYFRCMYEKEVFGISDEKKSEMQNARLKFYDDNANAYWFRFLQSLDGSCEMGEDISFCFLAKRYAGIPIYMDTGVQPGHIGDYVYSIKDFLPHQEVAIRRWKASELATKREQEEKQLGGKITVMIPTLTWATQSIENLKVKASKPELVEVLTNDDVRGYSKMHEYFNEMAARSTGDWLMLWNDDAVMLEQGWDEKIRHAGQGLKILNFTGEMNVFPAVHRSVYEAIGHIALNAHCDTWLQVISRECQIEEYIPLQIEHTPNVEKYADTRKEFFSESVQKLLVEDVNKVMKALEAKQELVAVG